ncbi:hypothetical protein LCGC14_1687320 [marine sediment metagenome]|uniref:Uncharacterized protein n=1 Tax=marine sediment metagenome TaxID=412755 RepID=A0A0F9HM85_9ZZZZ
MTTKIVSSRSTAPLEYLIGVLASIKVESWLKQEVVYPSEVQTLSYEEVCKLAASRIDHRARASL